MSSFIECQFLLNKPLRPYHCRTLHWRFFPPPAFCTRAISDTDFTKVGAHIANTCQVGRLVAPRGQGSCRSSGYVAGRQMIWACRITQRCRLHDLAWLDWVAEVHRHFFSGDWPKWGMDAKQLVPLPEAPLVGHREHARNLPTLQWDICGALRCSSCARGFHTPPQDGHCASLPHQA